MDLNDPEFICDPVHWPEGERDIDTIVKLGLLGLTFGGASSLPESCEQWVAGRPVVILADNDIAGRKHAEAKAALCASISASVKVVHFHDTAPGSDVTDWLNAGHSIEKLLTLIDETPSWKAEQRRSEAEPQASVTEALLAQLADLSPAEYGRRRVTAAAELGIGLAYLDEERKVRRQQVDAVNVPPLYEHWVVEPWAEKVDGAVLLLALVNRIQRHVAMNDDAALTAALWVMMTWAHEDAAIHSPILMATSAEPNSGKSTLLGVVGFLVPRPLLCVEISEATVFRSIELWKPTIIADEADVIFVDKESLRAVINSGWPRGSGVPRCVGDDNIPKLFSTFCPKAIGLKGRKLPDTTLSRAIIIELKRKRAGESVQRFRHIDDPELADLRRQALRWATDHAEILQDANPVLPDGFDNRLGDNWRLLIAIADAVGGEWPEKARKAAEKLSATVDTNSAGIDVLAAIKVEFDRTQETCMSSANLVGRLTIDPESRWHEWKAGKPLTQKQLAGLLKQYGIVSGTVHPAGVADAKGYQRQQFEEAWDSIFRC